MTVAITASEITTKGNGGVTVFTPPPAGGRSSPFSFPITGPPPPNDNFANAISASSNFTDAEDSSGATTEAGEPQPPPACTINPSPNTHSIWYKFFAPANGPITADTNDTAYDSVLQAVTGDRKSTRLNSSHVRISYAVFCLKKKKTDVIQPLLQE